jgi:hypothetical protein
MRLRGVWWLFLTISGMPSLLFSIFHFCPPFLYSYPRIILYRSLLTTNRLLDKIAKDILVCENKTIHRWDGSIGEYKNHLRKKMLGAGAV